MKTIRLISYLLLVLAAASSCVPERIRDPHFEDQEHRSIYIYINDSITLYSKFLSILEAGGVDKTLSAYNPDGEDYTLFLPANAAVDRFIEESAYSSLDELLGDTEYVQALARFHVVNLGINSNDFPFGALPEYTLSGDLLTVGFVIETDTSYYKINNQAPVVQTNIELSNGYIHIISTMLKPITYTSYQWLEQNPGYSIFKAAVDATGLTDTIDINLKDENEESFPSTLFIEHDSVFNEAGIYSLDDLKDTISPDDQDYTNTLNPLYNFVAYHILVGNNFLDDFFEVASNYTTYSDIPVNVNGLGLDIVVNKTKQIFDTIIYLGDTTFIDYIGFNYDASNVITQSGAIHFIDRVMKQQRPTPAQQHFTFWEEPWINERRTEPGEYIVDDPEALYHISWTGPELYLIKEVDTQHPAWNDDYLFIDGDFAITYRIPRFVQGKYDVFLGANNYDGRNAVIEVFVDGKNIGGIQDLATGGSANNTFAQRELGSIDFIRYEDHVVEIKSLIPGRFEWDRISFIPHVED